MVAVLAGSSAAASTSGAAPSFCSNSSHDNIVFLNLFSYFY
jgi:hypothetical protein